MASQFEPLSAMPIEAINAARRAESLAHPDPRAACFYARRALELLVNWAYENDAALTLPYREDLSAMIHEATFRRLVGEAVFYKCRAIKELGNQAVHSVKPMTTQESVPAVRELFHVCYWFARTYAKSDPPPAGLQFDPNLLPRESPLPKTTLDQLKALSDALDQEREKLFEVLAVKETLDEELQRVRAEIAALRQTNDARPDDHDYSEADTRDLFIDLLLKEAGWALANPQDREYEVPGMPNNQGVGFVDYVLWGDDGKPLGLVEAKRTRRDPRQGQHQAKLYADCLEAQTGQRPVIFYTNGYDHWIWDDAMYPPRAVQGFYKKAELELLIQRRQTRRPLRTARIDEEIVERYYQTRAIRAIGEAFEKDHLRRSLLVMATGSGKTRTVIALVEQMMRANWIKQALFLADRTALVKQAVGAFKRHLPEVATVNLVTERNGEGRVYVSTYPTMIGLIDDTKGSERRFGPGHFDLVIIDEAHRSVFMKYQAIFEYFDSLLVGLTATPKDEVDRNTYRLFDLEDGVPTDVYSLEQAVADGYLVPPRSVSVPMRLPSQGLIYDQLSDEEKEQFELTDWKDRDDVIQTGRVEPAAINQWLFNIDTVDMVLKHVIERGLKVDQGDKLGKTILFAKNHDHAVFIAERFNRNYPQYRGKFAQVIDFKVEYAQNLIDDFSDPAKFPQLAISVDMLDTGIDVPEVVNLVFFKPVRSKTKFWQMVGRGTRLCPNLLGPGVDKDCFYIFDFCGNLEFFSQQVDGTEGASGASLGKRLFETRLKLIAAIAKNKEGADVVREHLAQYGSEPATEEQLMESIVKLLRVEVGAMNTDNFIVRAKRRLVEKYKDAAQWKTLDEAKIEELEHDIAGLPSELPSEQVESKQFDLLILRLQLALLSGSKAFPKMQQQVQEIARSLEEAANIPMVQQQLALIQDLQSDDWWKDVTLTMLEVVRLRLRMLVPLVQHRRGLPVYTDFSDEMGDESEIAIVGLTDGISFERFREKARQFLRNNLDREAIQKLRLNIPLSESDLQELEAILRESGFGNDQTIAKASEMGLGLFVRSLVGLDREAAKSAMNTFLGGKNLTANQIEFVNMIVDYLTEHGVMEPRALYESPFIDISSGGPESVFSDAEIEAILQTLESTRNSAILG